MPLGTSCFWAMFFLPKEEVLSPGSAESPGELFKHCCQTCDWALLLSRLPGDSQV